MNELGPVIVDDIPPILQPRSETGLRPGKNDDPAVVHPQHYNVNPSGVECWDIVQWYSMNVGSAMKYLWRCTEKNSDPRQDLRKAIQWAQKEIERYDLMEENGK